jgi:hypothetical protein
VQKLVVKPFEIEKPIDVGGQQITLKTAGARALLKVVLGAKPAPPPMIATSMEDIQRPQMMLVPVFMFECNPDATEEEEWHFLITPANKVITLEDELLFHCDTLLYPDGKIFFIYEIK